MNDKPHDEIKHDAVPGFIPYYYIVLGLAWLYLLYTFFHAGGGGHH